MSMYTYLTKSKIIGHQNSFYRRFAIHSSVGVCFQLSKWSKSTGLILTLFDNINKNFSWDCSMPSRLEYPKHYIEWSFIDPIHWNTERRDSCCVSFCTLSQRRAWPTTCYCHWCIHHDCRHHYPNSFQLGRNVHWSSVISPVARQLKVCTDLVTYCSVLLGFGLALAASAAPVLVTEIAFPTQRAQLTSMYNSLW